MSRARGINRVLAPALTVLVLVLVLGCAQSGGAQEGGAERTFPQSKATVEKALGEMRASSAGRLPSLEGFATGAEHPLERYQRGYYQATFQVSSLPAGESKVRVSVQVTAWYADPATGKSGYQALPSNGRLEADLLDQLTDQIVQIAKAPQTKALPPAAAPQTAEKHPTAPEPTISAPVPRLPETSGGLSSSLAQGLAQSNNQSKKSTSSRSGAESLGDSNKSELQSEADSLGEILKNLAHPKNLVAVKKSGTPVVVSASLTAKTLFLASAHDEFEMLDFNRDWVHVRISGLSRGSIWRNNLEMPDSVPDSDLPANPAAAPVAADLFHVSREESAPFPGDWAPLTGKTVKIVSVEKTNEAEKDASPKVRLEFVKSVFDKDYAELSKPPAELAGIVVIFDSADGGMIAATLPALKQWKAGKLSDAALWHQCFFDPPETFVETGSGGSE